MKLNKKMKMNLTNVKLKFKAVCWLLENKSKPAILVKTKFDISGCERTFQKWRKMSDENFAKLKAAANSPKKSKLKKIRSSVSKFPKLDKHLNSLRLKRKEFNLDRSTDWLRDEVKRVKLDNDIKKQLNLGPGFDNFSASNGYIKRFMKRNSLTTKKKTSTKSITVCEFLNKRHKWLKVEINFIKENSVLMTNIFNLDETPLSLEYTKRQLEEKSETRVLVNELNISCKGKYRAATICPIIRIDGTCLFMVIILFGSKTTGGLRLWFAEP